MRSVDLPPFAPILMESTRAIGYSIEAAIADIIDNSIASGAITVSIDFFPIGDAYISLCDNGSGMTEQELIAAMQYGSKNPNDSRNESDLGRYGLGMKTASLSQCRILTVLSKKNGIISGCEWNLNYINQTKSWSLIILDFEEIKKIPNYNKLESNDSGTLVVWQDLDKISIGENSLSEAFSRKISLIRDHLSLVFHRYLNGEPGLKKMDIIMNEFSIIPHDPFLVKKSTLLMDEEIIEIRGSQIKIKPFILPHTSKLSKTELEGLGGKEGLRKQQGFYVYRNKRLLIWGTWFRLMRQGDLSKLARVQVDIPNSLDDLWTLDIKKSSAVPPEEVKKNLSIVVNRISEGSKRTWTYRGKKENNDKVIHLWNRIVSRDGGVFYEINTSHPLVKSISTEFPHVQKQVYIILKEIGKALPLNSLYVDLTNDEKFINDRETNSTETLALLKSIIESTNPELHESLMESLKLTEPFCNHLEEIEEYLEARS